MVFGAYSLRRTNATLICRRNGNLRAMQLLLGGFARRATEPAPCQIPELGPAATWTNRFLAPTYILAGRAEEARQSFATFTAEFPDLTIADVRSGLPWNSHYIDRTADGLETLGMHPS